MPARRADIRNIAIIAHVDHGKTTLVDGLLAQAGALGRGQVHECILDSKDQERERGITILAKNCAVDYHGVRINIIDTPGHADFGGEVERVLRMADGCLLLVDAAEGPMPQTRFVLRKALEAKLKPVVVINKIDKPDARPKEALDGIFDLMAALGAEDWQLDFPVVYGSGRARFMVRDLTDERRDLGPLFEIILAHVPGPEHEPDRPLRLQVANLSYNDFVGRIAIGRIYSGRIGTGQEVVLVKGPEGVPRRARVLQLHHGSGLAKEEIAEGTAGDIVEVTGLGQVEISETICDVDHPDALPPIPIDEPTIRMTLGVTTSPLAGMDGKPLQSRDLRIRLDREMERNVAMRLSTTPMPNIFEVSGRGMLHLSVLIEDMRREGFEFQVGPPRVIIRQDGQGNTLEPIEFAALEVPEGVANRVVNLFLERRGELVAMHHHEGWQHLEFTIPSRGCFGLRTLVLTASQGEATMHTVFDRYGPWRGPIPYHRGGAMVSICAGEAVAYSLWKLEDRGAFFIGPQTIVYEGMIVGEHAKDKDLGVNVTTGKKLTNVRSAGNDEAVRLTPPRSFSLEESLEWLGTDELLEVTPHHLRLRKALLKEMDRKKAAREEGSKG